MLAIVAAMAFIPEQRVPLVFGLVSARVLLAAWRACARVLRREVAG